MAGADQAGLHPARRTGLDRRLWPGHGGRREILFRTHRRVRFRLGLSVRKAERGRGHRCPQRRHSPDRSLQALRGHCPALLRRSHRVQGGGRGGGRQFHHRNARAMRPVPVRQLGAERQGHAQGKPRLAGRQTAVGHHRDLHCPRRSGGPAGLGSGCLRLYPRRCQCRAAAEGKPARRCHADRSALDPLCLADDQHRVGNAEGHPAAPGHPICL